MSLQNKRMLVMLPVLAVVGYLALFGDKTPVNEVAAPVAQTAEDMPAAQTEAVASLPEAMSAAPVAEGELLRVASREKLIRLVDSPQARDLFAAAGPPPQEAPPPDAQAQQPPPPVQPFALIGRELAGKQWRYFLEKDGQVYVLAPGEQVEGFRLERSPAGEVALVEIATKTRHIIPIEGE